MLSYGQFSSTVFEWLSGSETPFTAYLWHSSPKSSFEWSCYVSPETFQSPSSRLRSIQRTEMSFASYGTNENLDSRTITENRFTRVIFGSGPSPYILWATRKKHESQYNAKFPSTTDELRNNTYVDYVQSSGITWFKEEATRNMGEGGFHLHKRHSNRTVTC